MKTAVVKQCRNCGETWSVLCSYTELDGDGAHRQEPLCLHSPTCTYLDFCSGFYIQAFTEQPKQLAMACAFRQPSGQRLLFCQNKQL